MRLSTFFVYMQPCVSIWKRRPGSNPQPIELCADIGQVHLMLIWRWLGRTLVILTNGQPSADIKWSFKVRTGATRPQTILKCRLPSSLDYRTRHGSQSGGSCNPSYWEVGGLGSGYSYHMSVRTRLSDHTMQTKVQSQRPSNVETHVPCIWVQKLSSIGTVSTWIGDLVGLCSSYLQGKS
jgi:hypothetical protein